MTRRGAGLAALALTTAVSLGTATVASAAEPPEMVVGILPITGSADAASRANATKILEDALRALQGLEVVSFAAADRLFGQGSRQALADCKTDDKPYVRAQVN